MGRHRWWEQGVRFECQGTGCCCVTRGQFGFVYVSRTERRRLAQLLGIQPAAFTRRYCRRTGPTFRLIDRPGSADCIFLENGRCGVYEARPLQCRTWPFWPEMMNPRVWKREVVPLCAGVGRGRLVPAKEIEASLKAMTQSDDQAD